MTEEIITLFMSSPSARSSVQSLSNALLASHHCSSQEEADAIANVILHDVMNCDSIVESNDLSQEVLLKALKDYFDLAPEEAVGILHLATGADSNNDDSCDDTDSESLEEEPDQGTNDEEDGEMIGEGECELCERLVQLTRHHLIPKSTHARMESKLFNAAAAIAVGEPERAERILGVGLQHTLDQLQHATKSNIRRILNQTSDICRPCHSAIHKTHDNMTLALNYNTVDQLLEDEQIYKFCQWASKQKPGKYALKT